MVSFTALVGYLVLFTVLGVVFLFSVLLIGKLVRPTLPNPEKDAIYECGEPTIGSSWVQFDLRFYVVALLFVVFDVEVAFFFPWAVVFGKTTRVADPSATAAEARVPLHELGYELDHQVRLSFAPGYDLDFTAKPLTAAEAKPLDLKEGDGVVVSSIEKTSPLAAAHIAVGDVIRQVNGKTIRSQADLAESLVAGEAPESVLLLVRPNLDTTHSDAAMLGRIAFVDLLVFFGVVLVGFIYLWKRGDLDWVRALQEDQSAESTTPATPSASWSDSPPPEPARSAAGSAI